LRSSLGRLFEHDRGSGRVRKDDLRVTVSLLEHHPLRAAGPGGWADAASAQGHALPSGHASAWVSLPPRSASSQIALLGAETGILGLACAALMLLGFARAAARPLRRCDPGSGPPAASDALDRTACLAALAIVTVDSCFDTPLSRAAEVAQLAVVLGILATRVADRKAAGSPRRLRIAGIAWVLLGGLALLPPALEVIAAELCQVGGYTARAHQQAWRWFPRAADAQAVVLESGVDRCNTPVVLAWLQREMPHLYGPLEVAAQCAARGGRGEEARELLDRAIALEPHDADLLEARERLGETDPARSAQPSPTDRPPPSR
jgi:hypothetical protein